MLRDGKTIGTFQLESPAQREMAGRLLPNCFNDIVVSLSLVRPGPLKSSMDKEYLLRRHGKLPVTYLHPKLEAALHESLGVILYQEQVLKVAHDLAGMSYAEADGFRRAMTHDRTEREMESMRASFIFGTTKNGVDRRAAERVFEQLAAFAAYGFCKAHAATYAILAYQTLWLKCHYPAEYFAAVLSNQPMGYYPPRVLLAEAKRSGVKVLPPDINKSPAQFSVEKGAIRVGLKQLRGISGATLRAIIRERGNGRFTTLRDFVARTGVDQPMLQSLVKIGAFDSLEKRTRGELLLEITTLTANSQNTKGARFQWQYPHEGSEVMRDTHCSKRETMATERQLLSLDLLGHPLDLMADGKGYIRMKDLPSLPTGKGITIIGSVIRYQTPPTRNSNRVVYIIMEDGTGIADVTVFSDVQARCGQVLFRAGWLSVKGKIQRRGPRSLSIIASHLAEVSV
jgi:error-prone DNA polymerase